MDLSIIQTHLDNFVDTWNGWNAIFSNLDAWHNNFEGAWTALSAENGVSSVFTGLFENTAAAVEVLTETLSSTDADPEA